MRRIGRHDALRDCRPASPNGAVAPPRRAAAAWTSSSAGTRRAVCGVMFSWSYRALHPDAARPFRLLALHRGPDVAGRAAASLLGHSAGRASLLLTSAASEGAKPRNHRMGVSSIRELNGDGHVGGDPGRVRWFFNALTDLLAGRPFGNGLAVPRPAVHTPSVSARDSPAAVETFLHQE